MNTRGVLATESNPDTLWCRDLGEVRVGAPASVTVFDVFQKSLMFFILARSNRQRKAGKSQAQCTGYETTQNKSNKHLPWRTAARLERNKYKSQNPLKTSDDPREEVPRRKTRESRTKSPDAVTEMDRLSLEDLEEKVITDNAEFRDMKIQLIDYKRRYENEIEHRAKADIRIRELEMENRKLRNEILLLKTTEKV